MERRAFLQRAIAVMTLGCAAVVGIPTVVTVASPGFKTRPQTWRAVGRVDEFPPGSVRRATVDVPSPDWGPSYPQAVYVWHSPQGLVVFSRNCTDLSCPVVFDPGSERFFCPCHGGIFAKDGSVVAGPPQRPLYRYDTRIVDGRIEIDLASLPPVT